MRRWGALVLAFVSAAVLTACQPAGGGGSSAWEPVPEAPALPEEPEASEEALPVAPAPMPLPTSIFAETGRHDYRVVHDFAEDSRVPTGVWKHAGGYTMKYYIDGGVSVREGASGAFADSRELFRIEGQHMMEEMDVNDRYIVWRESEVENGYVTEITLYYYDRQTGEKKVALAFDVDSEKGIYYPYYGLELSGSRFVCLTQNTAISEEASFSAYDMQKQGFETIVSWRWIDGEVFTPVEDFLVRGDLLVYSITNSEVPEKNNAIYVYDLVNRRQMAELHLDGEPWEIGSNMLRDIDYDPATGIFAFFADTDGDARSRSIAWMKEGEPEPHIIEETLGDFPTIGIDNGVVYYQEHTYNGQEEALFAVAYDTATGDANYIPDCYHVDSYDGQIYGLRQAEGEAAQLIEFE
ncbi:MAG: hypothetical protein LBR44_08250 [Clostridiales Family XIII bacterium]|nr:hypothetical protein [Clostridiales Family XIII bacterium]